MKLCLILTLGALLCASSVFAGEGLLSGHGGASAQTMPTAGFGNPVLPNGKTMAAKIKAFSGKTFCVVTDSASDKNIIGVVVTVMDPYSTGYLVPFAICRARAFDTNGVTIGTADHENWIELK